MYLSTKVNKHDAHPSIHSVSRPFNRRRRDARGRSHLAIRLAHHRSPDGSIREGVQRLRSRVTCDRREFLHGGIAPRARGAGHREGRRSHHYTAYLLRHGARHPACGRQTRSGRHRRRRQHRSRRDRPGGHAAHARYHSGALFRSAVRYEGHLEAGSQICAVRDRGRRSCRRNPLRRLPHRNDSGRDRRRRERCGSF